MMLTNFNSNTELNAGGIPMPLNVHKKSLLEPDGVKQTQVEGIFR